MSARRLLLVSVFVALIGACLAPAQRPAADLLLTNGVVYTGRDMPAANTVAIRADRIVFVGNRGDAERLRSGLTREIDLGGRLLIPGLHDVHLHPLGIVSPGGCDLDSEILSLSALVPRLQRCIKNGAADDSGWLIVSQWNFTAGNQQSADFPGMRAALDAVSRDIPIILLGNDGHHGAVNSATLSRAVNGVGQLSALNRHTLVSDFSAYREYIAVDATGEPNGYVNETARELFGAPGSLLFEIPPVSVMPAVAAKLASYGITSIRDASALIETLPLYDALYGSGAQTFRLSLALFPSFDDYDDGAGRPDIGRMVADMSQIRARYAGHPLIRADTVKLFVDGVIEGDPRSVPPTLPNAAQLEPYRQPLFSHEGDRLSIDGYVDLDGPVCREIRRVPDRFVSETGVLAFQAEHGFHPRQCNKSRGVLEHPVDVIDQYIKAFDAAGFAVHAHAIGDRAVRTAIDAFGRTTRTNNKVVLAHGIGHAQLVHPDDIQRAGRLGLNIAFTYAWIIPDLAYDLTVIPFVDRVDRDSLYREQNYTFQNSYPVASLLQAGVLLTAGSDAPVDSREPRPFENIEQAITRANEDGVVFNANERIDIHAALAAYTINGAAALNQAELTGSIAIGKKADLVLLDRNIVKLADSAKASEISDTTVLMTIFDGEIVYSAPGFHAGAHGH